MIIDKDGTYELSSTENGVSNIQLFNNFFNKKEADELFDYLQKELPWEVRLNTKYNEEEPRLTCWIGEHPYIYSGVEWKPHAFTRSTEIIGDKLEKELGYRFNSVLGNLYRDGRDTVAWHSDDEIMLGKHPFIASISLGSTRTFEMRRKIPHVDESTIYQIPVMHGSLLIMQGATQDDWQHRIPSEQDAEIGPRINLTYRTIYPS